MGTPGSRSDGVQSVSDEFDVGNAADEAAMVRIRLAGGKAVEDGRSVAVRIDFGNPRGIATGIRSERRRNLLTQADCRSYSASSSLGDVEVAVGPEREATRVV